MNSTRMEILPPTPLPNSDAVWPAPLAYHALWSGRLTDKHVTSILSCFRFCANRTDRSITLWTDGETEAMAAQVAPYARVRRLKLDELAAGTPLANATRHKSAAFSTANSRAKSYANEARLLILLKYGGVWFDLDVLFLRPMDPLLVAYPRAFTYAWPHMPYPNNAVLFAPRANDETIVRTVAHLTAKKKGFSFQQARFTYNSPVPLLVLPSEWFDPAWVHGVDFCAFFKKSKADVEKVTFASFGGGAFTYHWHNCWDAKAEAGSPFLQLAAQLRNPQDSLDFARTERVDFRMKFMRNEAWYGSSVGVEDLIALGGTVFLLMWLVFGAVWVWVMLLRPGARPKREPKSALLASE